MIYRTLADCVADLEQSGQLRRVEVPLSPRLEIAAVQRRAQRLGGPALLFTRVKHHGNGFGFPMLGNLFGTPERTRHIFRSSLRGLQNLLRAFSDPLDALRHPWRNKSAALAALHALPSKVKDGPALAGACSLAALPGLVSWPRDGGAYITLPQVYTESPARPGPARSNLGMYRVQLNGPALGPDQAALHYQIHRGLGTHHMEALAMGERLPVNIFVGGPPALSLAAIMPLPEGLPELHFAGLLAGHRIPLIHRPGSLPVPAEADFCIRGSIGPELVLEGPFGDHLGYYSLEHEFPLLRVQAVHHRPGAIWPFTSVGRPPREDSVLGAFIQELLGPLASRVFSGIHEVHAVDAAGVHPLLLALGSERYVPFAAERAPLELQTCGLSLLGNTQTSLAKYLLIAAKEDSPALTTRNIPEFFAHILRRTDFSRDLHFITRASMDTLDYSGTALNQGSKLLWTAAGPVLRSLAGALPPMQLTDSFSSLQLFAPGIAVCRGPKHTLGRDVEDPRLEDLAAHIHNQGQDAAQGLALLIVCDDPDFCARDWDNFLWVAFTKSDPATDIYGPAATTHCKHWSCSAPLIIDARAKPFHAPALEEDPEVQAKIDALGAPGGPLHGVV